jgi:hypothetical protein
VLADTIDAATSGRSEKSLGGTPGAVHLPLVALIAPSAVFVRPPLPVMRRAFWIMRLFIIFSFN